MCLRDTFKRYIRNDKEMKILIKINLFSITKVIIIKFNYKSFNYQVIYIYIIIAKKMLKMCTPVIRCSIPVELYELATVDLGLGTHYFWLQKSGNVIYIIVNSLLSLDYLKILEHH